MTRASNSMHHFCIFTNVLHGIRATHFPTFCTCLLMHQHAINLGASGIPFHLFVTHMVSDHCWTGNAVLKWSRLNHTTSLTILNNPISAGMHVVLGVLTEVEGGRSASDKRLIESHP
eukprot:5901745-Pleurochrysis_carterae.AAC.2